jgi:hypothetical protein
MFTTILMLASSFSLVLYHILSGIVCTFYIENDAEIFPAHYNWKVAEKRFKMAFMMNKLARIISCEIILEKYFFCQISLWNQVRTILACTLYSIKYSTLGKVMSLTLEFNNKVTVSNRNLLIGVFIFKKIASYGRFCHIYWTLGYAQDNWLT